MMRVLLFISCWIISSTVFAAAKSSAAPGSWSTPANWSPASVPNSGDDVTITHAITYTGSLDGSSYNSLTIASGAKLTVSSDFVLNSGHAVVIQSGGTLQVQGSILSTGNGSISNSGIITVTKDLSIESGNTFINNSGASITIGRNILSPGNGSFTNHGTTFIAGYAELRFGSGYVNDGVTTIVGDLNLFNSYLLDNTNGDLVIGGTLWSTDYTVDIQNANGSISVRVDDRGIDVDILGGALPIELSTFQAQQQQQKVVLQWETLSELSNDFFTLERSYDGVRFESIADIDGAGSSKQKHCYKYVDDVYSLRSSLLYYRLSQTDFDGANSHSQVLSVPYVPLIDDEFNVFTQGSQILIVPNKKGRISIYSADGKMCYSSEIVSLDMLCVNSPLPAGVYLVSLLADDGIQSKSVLLR